MNKFIERWGPFLLPVVAGIGIVLLIWAIVATLPPSANPIVDDGIVSRVCRDGTLIVRKSGDFFVVRPDSWRGWRAASEKVCEAAP